MSFNCIAKGKNTEIAHIQTNQQNPSLKIGVSMKMNRPIKMGMRMKLSNIKNAIQTKLHGKVKKTMINERKELKTKN